MQFIMALVELLVVSETSLAKTLIPIELSKLLDGIKHIFVET